MSFRRPYVPRHEVEARRREAVALTLRTAREARLAALPPPDTRPVRDLDASAYRQAKRDAIRRLRAL